jgi:excisionase family DNA binding protein
LSPTSGLDQALRDLIRALVRDELRAVVREEFATLPSNTGQASQAVEGPVDTVLWGVAEASTFLRVSTSWLYHRAAAGTIPCIRVGHSLRFDPAALKAWTRGERGGGRVVPIK